MSMTQAQKRGVAIACLIFGAANLLSLFGCKDKVGDDDPKLTGKVNIDGIVKVGETLTANITDSNGAPGKFSYEWTRTPEGGVALKITDATGQQYTITEADVGHTLGAIVSNQGTTGTISGATTQKVPELVVETPQLRTDTINLEIATGPCTATVKGTLTAAQWNGLAPRIESIIQNSYNNASLRQKGRFGMFGSNKVVIVVEKDATFNQWSVLNMLLVHFDFDYFAGQSDEDLSIIFTDIAAEMSEAPVPEVAKAKAAFITGLFDNVNATVSGTNFYRRRVVTGTNFQINNPLV